MSRSAAWKYFEVVNGGAVCKVENCTHSFLKRSSGSSTKFLWSHLEIHHRHLATELGRPENKRTRSPMKDEQTNNYDFKYGFNDYKRYFKYEDHQDADGMTRKVGVCRKCRKEVSRSGSSTSGMRRHVRDCDYDGWDKLSKRKIRSYTKKEPVENDTVDAQCYLSNVSHTENFAYSHPSTSNTMNENLMDLINSTDTHVNNMAPTIVAEQSGVNDYFCKMLCTQLNQMNDKQAHMCREKIHSIVGQFLYNDQHSSFDPSYPLN